MDGDSLAEEPVVLRRRHGGKLAACQTLNFSKYVRLPASGTQGEKSRPRRQASSLTHFELRDSVSTELPLIELPTQIKTTEGQSVEDKESTVSGPHSSVLLRKESGKQNPGSTPCSEEQQAQSSGVGGAHHLYL